MSEKDLKESLKRVGYSLEEIWFHNRNQELLEEMRENAVAETKKAASRSHLRLIEGGLSDQSSEADAASAQPDPVKKAA
jgi:hypothetical protein